VRDDDHLQDRVMNRLHKIRTRLGPRAFRSAAQKALVGIGRAALAEAERRAAPKMAMDPGNRVRAAQTAETMPRREGDS
jgi:hypothetical protein